jgi:hypothetical protein
MARRGSTIPSRQGVSFALTENEAASALALLEHTLASVPLPDVLASGRSRFVASSEFRVDRKEILSARDAIIWFFHLPSGEEVGLLGLLLVLPPRNRKTREPLSFHKPCSSALWKEPPAQASQVRPWRWKHDLEPMENVVAKVRGPKRRPKA